jgi:hypothetical protein
VSFDWQKVAQSKKAYRRKLAAKPIAEKLRLLDAMHESALSIRRANRRQVNVVREEPPDYGIKS